ncbi:MAG: class I SAM-dependent methyltransferase [Planctomycetota bacterium]|nr:MAG: class I SAM-dependent methyltransferase [Planctomycetota bacterium]
MADFLPPVPSNPPFPAAERRTAAGAPAQAEAAPDGTGAARNGKDQPKKGKGKDEPKKGKDKKGKRRDKPKKGKGKDKKGKGKKGRKGGTKAERSDKYALYQRSVQAPDADIEFFDQVFERLHGRKPTTLREDFCGCALTCCEWVRTRPENRAWGVDLDPEPLAWGREHNLSRLDEEQRARVTLIRGDVREARRDPKVEVVAAQNFSFCIFKRREDLKGYFAAAREGLVDGGIFVLDIFGGPESIAPAEDETEHKGFSYIWDQKSYDAINNEIQCAIHFSFKDGSRLEDAFTYDWRLWTIRELKELLEEVGFRRADAYWEGCDEDGEGNGEFTLQDHADQEDAWIAYVVGVK